jgi:shikimate kinase
VPAALRVLLVGLMGSGKTTVGRALAERQGWDWLDNDTLLRAAEGVGAAELAERGEAAVRAAEGRVLRSVLRRPGPWVASAAAGTVLDPALRAAVGDSGVLVGWVRLPTDELVRRLEQAEERGAPQRPWLAADLPGTVARMAAEREPLYAALADVIIDCSGRTTEDLVAEAVAHLARGSR